MPKGWDPADYLISPPLKVALALRPVGKNSMPLPRKVSCGWSRICATGRHPDGSARTMVCRRSRPRAFTGPATCWQMRWHPGDYCRHAGAKLAPYSPRITARLRDEAGDHARKRSAAKRQADPLPNMDSLGRWLARDLGPAISFITNVPEFPAASDGKRTASSSTYRTVVGKKLTGGALQKKTRSPPTATPQLAEMVEGRGFQPDLDRCRNSIVKGARGLGRNRCSPTPHGRSGNPLCRQAQGADGYVKRRGAAALGPGQFAGADESWRWPNPHAIFFHVHRPSSPPVRRNDSAPVQWLHPHRTGRWNWRIT